MKYYIVRTLKPFPSCSVGLLWDLVGGSFAYWMVSSCVFFPCKIETWNLKFWEYWLVKIEEFVFKKTFLFSECTLSLSWVRRWRMASLPKCGLARGHDKARLMGVASHRSLPGGKLKLSSFFLGFWRRAMPSTHGAQTALATTTAHATWPTFEVPRALCRWCVSCWGRVGDTA